MPSLSMPTPSNISMSIPVPPDTVDLNSLHRWALSITKWLSNNHLQGLQTTPMSQTELDLMTANNDLTQSGKLFANTSDGKNYQATVVAGTLTITAI